MPISYILMDVEGTITPIDFVHRKLFPYSQAHFKRFLEEEWESPRVLEWRKALCTHHQTNERVDDIHRLLDSWVAQDKKEPALKTIQGWIWEKGYQIGELKGELYPDVLPKWQTWRKQGVSLGFYSSGSVLAQKLLVKHSTEGDLSEYISHYFDTKMGQKREPNSYRQISKSLASDVGTIVFLSDVSEELKAAELAGLKVRHIVRKGTAPSEAYQPYQDLLSLDF